MFGRFDFSDNAKIVPADIKNRKIIMKISASKRLPDIVKTCPIIIVE